MRWKRDKSSLATDWYETQHRQTIFCWMVNEPINQKQYNNSLFLLNNVMLSSISSFYGILNFLNKMLMYLCCNWPSWSLVGNSFNDLNTRLGNHLELFFTNFKLKDQQCLILTLKTGRAYSGQFSVPGHKISSEVLIQKSVDRGFQTAPTPPCLAAPPSSSGVINRLWSVPNWSGVW